MRWEFKNKGLKLFFISNVQKSNPWKKNKVLCNGTAGRLSEMQEVGSKNDSALGKFEMDKHIAFFANVNSFIASATDIAAC